MKMTVNKFLLLVLLLVFILFGNLNITLSTKKVEHNIVYNGIALVLSDIYTIKRYSSNDTPKSFFKYKKKELK